MILYAPDSYGGFLTAPEAVALAQEIRPDIVGHPMSDGGEGLLSALGTHFSLCWETHRVSGPHHQRIDARLGRMGDLTIIEAAEACGLKHTARRDPLHATTAGVASLLKQAGSSVLLGLGGSATIDGGIGMLCSLGLSAHGERGHTPDWALSRCTRLVGPWLSLSSVTVLLDVDTPIGEAAAVFGPQKGLHDADIPMVTDHLLRWTDTLNAWRASSGLPAIPADLPGGGAAGGLGFALAAAGARLRPGALDFADRTGLSAAIARADVVVLGEGRLDATSFQGKVASVVSRRARQAGKPVWAVVGVATDPPPPPLGPDRIIEIGGMDTALFKTAIRRL